MLQSLAICRYFWIHLSESQRHVESMLRQGAFQFSQCFIWKRSAQIPGGSPWIRHLWGFKSHHISVKSLNTAAPLSWARLAGKFLHPDLRGLKKDIRTVGWFNYRQWFCWLMESKHKSINEIYTSIPHIYIYIYLCIKPASNHWVIFDSMFLSFGPWNPRAYDWPIKSKPSLLNDLMSIYCYWSMGDE